MKTSKIIAIILLIVSVVLAVVCVIVLPQTVVMQISISGSDANTMPKWGAILLPTVLGIGFSLTVLLDKELKGSAAKSLFVSAVGIIVFIFELVVNC